MLKKLFKRFRDFQNRPLEESLFELRKRLIHIEDKVTHSSGNGNARIENIENRLNKLEQRNRELGFDQLGGRIDYRLTRLELLLHYADKSRYYKLDKNQKDIIRDLENEYLKRLPMKFPKVTPPLYKRQGKFMHRYKARWRVVLLGFQGKEDLYVA